MGGFAKAGNVSGFSKPGKVSFGFEKAEQSVSFGLSKIERWIFRFFKCSV